MTTQDALDLLQSGGVLAAAVLVISALMTGRLVTKREYDKLQADFSELKKINNDANAELRQQSATNARLVEFTFTQNQQTERARRAPAEVPTEQLRRRETDQ